MIPRYLIPDIQDDLKKKMVFLAGPRQVGKTTLAEALLEKSKGLYYSWDNRQDRRTLLQAQWPDGQAMIVLDELHKYRFWKNWLKGEYDKHKNHLQFLITGSARMDIYRKGGDSLQGRYHHYRIHPFTLAELEKKLNAPQPFSKFILKEQGNKNTLSQLFTFGGFPEPFLAQTEKALRRWQKERLDRFFREDIRDLENIRDLSSLQLLADLLPGKVGNPLSLNSLREDLEVSHRAITHWMDVLERLYYVFRIPPYTNKAIRGLKKETKCYLWDWTLIENQGARFENMIASHLLKFCNYLEDTQGYKAMLYYVRDVDKREVDFLVAINKKPWFLVEAKLSDHTPSPHLNYFSKRLQVTQNFQVTFSDKKDFKNENIHVIPAHRFLANLI